MKSPWDSVKEGYLRLIEPVADYFVRRRVNPNVITTIGTLCTIAAAVIYAFGHISIAGWVLGLTALFDVLDGAVARRTGRETKFGAFYDSSLDRISDGMLLGGLTVFYATDTPRHSVTMVVICLIGDHRHIPHVVHARPGRCARHRRQGRDPPASRARSAALGAAGDLRARRSTAWCSRRSSPCSR